MLEEVFKDSYFRGKKSFNNSDVNLITEECLQTCRPGLLYRLVLQIRPLENSEELFEIMKQLHSLETA